MRSSGVMLRNGLSRVSVDDAEVFGAPRLFDDHLLLPPRPSFRHSKCSSPRESVHSRISSFSSPAEIEKQAAEIEGLLASADELVEDLDAECHEKEETPSMSTLQLIETQATLVHRLEAANANVLDLETKKSMGKMEAAALLGKELDGSCSWEPLCAQHESEIKELRRQLQIEHEISASFKLELQGKQNLHESFEKDLKEMKMENERASSEAIELRKELEMNVSEIQRLKKDLDRRNSDGLEKNLEAMSTAIELLQEKKDHKELLKSHEDNYIKLIEGLQAKYKDQQASMSKLADLLKEDLAKQDELRLMSSTEFQKANETITGLDEKLKECINVLEAKGDELLNLQTTLFQLHTEREAKEKLEKDVAVAKEDLRKTSGLLKTACLELEDSKKQTQEISCKLSHNERMLLESTNKIQELEEDNSKLHDALEHSMKRISNMASDSENYVDRRIVGKLLVTYFQRNNSQEVLNLMVRFLGLSEEDKIKIDYAQQASGRTGVHSILNITGRFVGGVLSSKSTDLSPKELRQNQTIAELWVDFLLKEAEQREKIESTEADNTRGLSNPGTTPPRQVPAEVDEGLRTTLLPLGSSTTNCKSSFLNCF